MSYVDTFGLLKRSDRSRTGSWFWLNAAEQFRDPGVRRIEHGGNSKDAKVAPVSRPKPVLLRRSADARSRPWTVLSDLLSHRRPHSAVSSLRVCTIGLSVNTRNPKPKTTPTPSLVIALLYSLCIQLNISTSSHHADWLLASGCFRHLVHRLPVLKTLLALFGVESCSSFAWEVL